MTIIAAICDEETQTTWYGSDTAAVNSGHQYICGPKFTRCGPWAVGITGDGRFETLVRLNTQDLGESETALVLADKIRSLVLADDFKPSAEVGAKYFPGNSMIIAGKGAVYSVCNAFSVDEFQSGVLCADGGGRDFALGADFAVRHRPVQERLVIALEAAIALSSGCGGQPWIAKL
jgi:hypothetical protein